MGLVTAARFCGAPEVIVVVVVLVIVLVTVVVEYVDVVTTVAIVEGEVYADLVFFSSSSKP